MRSLKPGWQRVRFAQMVTSAPRKARGWNAREDGIERYVALEHLDSNSLRIRRWSDPDDVGRNSDLRVFEPGDVILARRGIELRKVGFAEFRGVASGHALVFRANTDVVLTEFLPYFVQSDAFMGRADRFSVGSLSRTVNLSALMDEEFPLPPLEEQQRIAQRCAAETAVFDELTTTASIAKRARDSLIVHLYSGGGTHRVMQTELGLLPASWEVLPLGARFTVQLGKAISESARTGDSPIPYLRNANVQWNRLELDDVASMSFSEQERAKFDLRNGDVLACEARHVGKAAIWREEIPGAGYQNALHRIRAIGNDVPEYLLHCLYYLSITGRFLARTGVTTIPHLPAEHLRAMPFPFPPTEEQREIARAIEVFDRSTQEIERRLASARQRKSSVMDEMMQ